VPTAVHKRALKRAIDLAGGLEPLARHLKLPPTAVKFWLNASSPLPDDVFLKLVDLLLDRSVRELQTPRAESNAHVNDSGRNPSDS
jgi:hypothetical protein